MITLDQNITINALYYLIKKFPMELSYHIKVLAIWDFFPSRGEITVLNHRDPLDRTPINSDGVIHLYG